MTKATFKMLFQIIQPQVDKDRAAQVHYLFSRLMKNEICRDDFWQHMRSIVGEHLLRSALCKIQTQATRDSLTASSQLQSLPQPSVQQMSPSATQITADLSKSNEVENQEDLLRVQDFIDQTNIKPNKAEISSAQTLFPSSSAQIKLGCEAQGNNLKDEYSTMQSSQMGLMPPPRPTATSVSSKSSMPSLTSAIGPGNSTKARPKKKPSVSKKKTVKARDISSPPSSKKQKTSGAFLHQGIPQLNDISVLSGIDIREEEEHLFDGLKTDHLVSKASRRYVQEEEEKLIFHKTPLHKKLMETIAKCGLKNMSNDVEQCLSLCVEERMRGLVSDLIRLSKKRLDIEKKSHRTVITSDVKQQVMGINRKAHEEQPESTTGVDADKKHETAKDNKKEQFDKKAANVAIRAATGVADMMSKWQLMIDVKKKQGGIEKSYDSHQPGKDGKYAKKTSNQDRPEAFDTPALVGKDEREEVMMSQVTRCITVKDLITVLERDPHLSKSTLTYRLFNKVIADAAVGE